MGFPVVWTNLLAEQDVGTSEYAPLLTIYLLIFLSDEIAILVGALVVMRMGRLEERHGRVLKLAGGVLMGVLAVVMLVDPDLLENVAGAALVLGAAAALTVSAILLRAGADRLRGGSGPRRPVGGRAHRHP